MTAIFYLLNLLFIAMKMPDVYPAIIIGLFLTLAVELFEKLAEIMKLWWWVLH